MAYVSATDDAKRIRITLKKAFGITSRQVSVRASYASLCSAIDIRIHDPAVDICEVRNVAQAAERIARCEATGEILGGSNRYLTVDYSDRAYEAFAADNRLLIEGVIATMRGLEPHTGQVLTPELYVHRQSSWEYVVQTAPNAYGRARLPSLDCPALHTAVAASILTLRDHR